MNRSYELGFVIPNNVSEQETPAVITTVKGWIAAIGGEVVKVDFWGRRRLAYPINDFHEGYYVFVTMAIEPAKVTVLEHDLKLNSQILRYLIVRLDEETGKPAAEPEKPVAEPEKPVAEPEKPVAELDTPDAPAADTAE